MTSRPNSQNSNETSEEKKNFNSREALVVRGRRPNSRSNIDLIESGKKFTSYDIDELIARTGQ